MALAEGQFLAIPADAETYTLRAHGRPASFMRLSGTWGKDIGGCGVFRVNPGDGPKNVGDPVSYPKLTGIDSHYHDYDEYWIVLEGSGVVRIGDQEFVVRRGDCVATGKGHHHDIPIVHAPFKAVYLEESELEALITPDGGSLPDAVLHLATMPSKVIWGLVRTANYRLVPLPFADRPVPAMTSVTMSDPEMPPTLSALAHCSA